MSVNLIVEAQTRSDVGKGASRRLRRQGLVPVIVYGSNKDPENLLVEQHKIRKQLEQETFYSQILTLDVDGRKQKAILRDIQRHPYKPIVLHMDFLRITEDQAIRVNIPLHFLNEEQCHGVRMEGGVLSRLLNEVEVECLPKDLPEYIEVDVANLELGQTLHLSEITVPEGVTFTALAHESEHDTAVVNVHHMARPIEEEEEEGLEAEMDEDAEDSEASENEEDEQD